jgi:hypothetical protein
MTSDELDVDRIDHDLVYSLLAFVLRELAQNSPGVNGGLIFAALHAAWIDHVVDICPACARSMLEGAEGMCRDAREELADAPHSGEHVH